MFIYYVPLYNAKLVIIVSVKLSYVEQVGFIWWGERLTHCGLVMPYGDKDLGQHSLR